MRDETLRLRALADELDKKLEAAEKEAEEAFEWLTEARENEGNMAVKMVELKAELERYKLKVARQEEKISEQREKIWGMEEMCSINTAVLAAVINTVGVLSIAQDVINAALEEKIQVQSTYDVESRTYSITTVPAPSIAAAADTEE